MTLRKPYVRPPRSYPSAIPESQRRNASMTPVTGIPATATPKENAVRSEAYRRLVAAMPCKACGIVGYSQAAHSNSAGKGLGIKTDDRTCFALCCDRPGVAGCHGRFDRYELGGRIAQSLIEQAWAADTRRQILAAGLWPATLSQPQQEHPE